MSDLPTEEDAIGATRKHRWLTVERQTERLEVDGCRRIVSLDALTREQIIRMVREKTVIKVVHAVFLIDPRKRGPKRMLNDYEDFAERLSNLPRKCRGIIKDVDSGFVADTAPQRKVMLHMVRDQIRRQLTGRNSAENLKRGGQPLVFTEQQMRDAQLIWENVKRYPTWDDCKRAFPKDFTVWRAHKLWGKRQ